jgi:tetratricopeptide (TPR) repeat protein
MSLAPSVAAGLLVFMTAAPARAGGDRSKGAESLTRQDCLEFAEMVEETLSAAEPTLLDRSFNLDAVVDAAANGLGASDEMMAGFRRGAREAPGIGAQVAKAIAAGGRYAFLRVRALGGRPSVLFRLITDQGVNYHEYVLERSQAGGVKVVDVYVYATGELMSQTLRRTVKQAVAFEEHGLSRRLAAWEGDLAKGLQDVPRMQELFGAGRYAEALAMYRALPRTLQQDKSYMILLVLCAGQVSEEEYKDAVAEFRKLFPDDPALALISVDGLVMRGEYAEALAAVDRLDRIVGGDPYLDVVRSDICLGMGVPEKASAFARRAIRREPLLEEAHWAVVSVELERGDFAGVARALTEMEENLGFRVEGLEEDEAFAEFVSSQEYRDWLRLGEEDEPKPSEAEHGE